MLLEGIVGKLIILVAWTKMTHFRRMEVNGLVVSRLQPITLPLLEDNQIYFLYAIDSTIRSNCSSYISGNQEQMLQLFSYTLFVVCTSIVLLSKKNCLSVLQFLRNFIYGLFLFSWLSYKCVYPLFPLSVHV